MTKKVKKAVFPVGGLGTRFLPATKALPKEMLTITNKPLIQYAFEEAKAAGIEEFIFITGRNKNIINDHFDNVYELESYLSKREKHEALKLTSEWVPAPGNISFIRQQQPLGLGHAVWCARNFVKDEPFAVILADEMFISDKSSSLLSEMVANYNGGNMLAVSEVKREDVSKYGIVSVDDSTKNIMKISDMVEKPKVEEAPSNISIVGRYILDGKIFSYLENAEKGSGGEIQLTDSMRAMLKDNTKTYGYKFHGKRMDCGNHLGFLEANIQFALRDQALKKSAAKLIKEIASSI